MKTTLLRNKLLKYWPTLVFSLFTLITSFYQYLPEKVAYTLLKLPYVLLIALAIMVVRRLYKKKYKLYGLSKLFFILAAVLVCIYGFVSIWRFLHGGYEAARASLYLAMASIFGMAMFYAADSSVFSMRDKSRNILIIASELNALQLIIGAFTYGGIRASSLLENIMVYDCVMAALIPQLFHILSEEEDKKLYLFAELNLLIGISIILISGSRSTVLLLIPLSILSIVICCIRCRKLWKNCIAIILGISLCVTVLFSFNLYSARASVERVAGWPLSQEQIESETRNPQKQSLSGKTIIQPSTEALTLIQTSDNMRRTLWELSIEEIKKSPLIGTGTVYFNCQYGAIVLQQGSHSFILETWLVYGGIGAIVYGTIILCLLLSNLCNIRKQKETIWTLLSIGEILVLSLVQPLMSMVYVTSFFWFLAGCGHKRFDLNQE